MEVTAAGPDLSEARDESDDGEGLAAVPALCVFPALEPAFPPIALGTALLRS
jgi:hypothetical protein